MEIGPGRYQGNHWQPGFLFVREDAFAMAEGILATHVADYDHFGLNEIPREVGTRVIADWRSAASRLGELAVQDAGEALHFDAAFRAGLEGELEGQQDGIRHLLHELADACERFYETNDWVCVLGT